MDNLTFLAQNTRDANLARTIVQMLHALVLHDGIKARMEGDEITLNFMPEIEAAKGALRALGVNPDEPLPFSRPNTGADGKAPAWPE
ncbi:hypothetical protein F6X40_11325 [Paraburkholderia sp. UCT31]|uniref:hypothetical protein n=1 Tax=Paraburkholderia sp. UCT31 TaxID=2615209 RepID=UPI001654E083|nr:hypothetical protein [Paraburkholderia sp. UCT31]MBC8737395.1 hypothetical protein [Paraburkholderia sp. UCT31]